MVSELLRVTQLTNLARIGVLNQETSPCFPLALRLRKLTGPTLENKSALCTASLLSSLHLILTGFRANRNASGKELVAEKQLRQTWFFKACCIPEP